MTAIASRGIALYEDKVIFQSSGRLVALNARTGELEWDVPMQGSRASSSGPLVANGLILEGMGGCQRYEENKCFISAYDPDTGEQRWRFLTIALDGKPGGDSLGRPAESVSRRRRDLDHRQLRSRAQPHVLGHRAGEAVDAGEPRHGLARRRPLHELDGRARREHRQARVALRARARRSARPRRRVRARARRFRRREVGVVGRQGRRAVEARPPRRHVSRPRRDAVPERLGELRSRDGHAALSRRHPRARGRRLDRRLPEHRRRQELAGDELSPAVAAPDHSA